MTVSILLSEKGSIPTPEWWWHFVRSVDQRSQALSTDERIDIINTELLNWSAHLWQQGERGLFYTKQIAYIDFYDEQAYTWFVLRWS